MHTLIDARALSKLKWRCRRGLLENDLFVERFFARHEASLTQHQAQGLQVLMDLSDNDLLDLLLARKEPEGDRPHLAIIPRRPLLPRRRPASKIRGSWSPTPLSSRG